MENRADELWIVPLNWSKFQHYSDRTPPWIKLYLELLDKPEWLDLAPTAKAQLTTVWLLRARTQGPVSVVILRLYMPVESATRHFRVGLEQLNHAGFIAMFASKALALEKIREEARARAHTRERPRAREKAATTTSNGPTGWSPNMPPRDREAEARRLIHNHVLTEPFELDAYGFAEPLRSELQALL